MGRARQLHYTQHTAAVGDDEEDEALYDDVYDALNDQDSEYFKVVRGMAQDSIGSQQLTQDFYDTTVRSIKRRRVQKRSQSMP
jgi:hypothetical protein